VRISSRRIKQLRDFARIERDAILEYRGREGEDPLVTLADLPSVDELVVRELRDEILQDRGRLAEFSMARLAAMAEGAEAAEHRANADRVEFELLYEIAADNPELTGGAWEAAGRLEARP